MCASARFYGPGGAVLQRWSLGQVLGGVHLPQMPTSGGQLVLSQKETHQAPSEK